MYRLTIKRFGGFFLRDHPIWGEVRRLLEEHVALGCGHEVSRATLNIVVLCGCFYFLLV